ncbi:MAG: membrane dipeptidase [Candidatus Marinimicrobia bacterium]|jgi:membrane dipeptidase|nr:membrane dipeptidase [Candidatus Neomarinimicrobiota bacterium]MBT3629769.1 membrane dipeptidase [Candidatus Neomarinimicrobiota bacterium]MBT3825651.1 membrane dipeptidase [Candidatus Neomarinimicrobiota bacterium]MBT4132493.1 membrane dipeptidase [Candidatus Neomarinimicrobiota bacterium]MBT4296792.1 membrane dipeptidase [Candidatus Neomarinimicrobiota bacterium]
MQNRYSIRTLSDLLVITTSLIFVGCSAGNNAGSMSESDILSFHQQILTIDTHVDTPLRLKYEGIDLSQHHDPHEYHSKLDFPRMDEGGLDAVFFAIWTPQGARTDSGHSAIKQQALDILDIVEAEIGKLSQYAEIVTHSQDASRLQTLGKHAIYLGLENGYPIGTDINNLELFYKRGIRYITLCHMTNNEICDSSNDTTEYGGLSPFGLKVIKRMNQLGMMVDISHSSEATVEQAVASSRAPVIASHSCSKAMCDNPRNLSDSLLTLIAAKGGVVQMCLLSDYITPDPPQEGRDSAQAVLKQKWKDIDRQTDTNREAYRLELSELNRNFPRVLPSVADAVDHIDHMVKLIGIDHVGIGTDFDGGAALSDCFDVSELPNITLELFKRGYSKSDIRKIWSGNLLRVFSKVEHLAATL